MAKLRTCEFPERTLDLCSLRTMARFKLAFAQALLFFLMSTGGRQQMLSLPGMARPREVSLDLFGVHGRVSAGLLLAHFLAHLLRPCPRRQPLRRLSATAMRHTQLLTRRPTSRLPVPHRRDILDIQDQVSQRTGTRRSTCLNPTRQEGRTATPRPPRIRPLGKGRRGTTAKATMETGRVTTGGTSEIQEHPGRSRRGVNTARATRIRGARALEITPMPDEVACIISPFRAAVRTLPDSICINAQALASNPMRRSGKDIPSSVWKGEFHRSGRGMIQDDAASLPNGDLNSESRNDTSSSSIQASLFRAELWVPMLSGLARDLGSKQKYDSCAASASFGFPCR